MISPEGERIIFTGKTVSPKGDVIYKNDIFRQKYGCHLFKNA